MWNFEGTTKSKNINLGGNVQSLSKTDILKNSREERKKREANRVKNKAALIIQKAYRLKQLSNALKSEFRAEFDMLAQFDVNKIKLEAFYRLLKILLTFNEIDKDQARVSMMLTALLKADDNKTYLAFAGFSDNELNTCWPYVINAMARISIKYYQYLNQECIQFLLLITDKVQFNRTSNKVNNLPVYDFIQNKLAENELFRELQRAIQLDIQSSNQFKILSRILKSTSSYPNLSLNIIHQKFIIQILNSISLTERLTPLYFNQFLRQLPIPLFAFNLHDLMKSGVLLDKMDLQQRFTLLCNVIDILPNLNKFNDKDLLFFVESISFLVSHSYKQIELKMDKNDSDSDSDNEDKVNLSELKSNHPIPILNEKQRSAIDKLSSMEFLGYLLKSIVNTESVLFIPLTLLMFNIITQWPHSKFKIAALIKSVFPVETLGKAFVPLLWSKIYPSEFMNRLSLFQRDIVNDSSLKEYWSILYLFIMLTDQRLSVLGDDQVADDTGIHQLRPSDFENLVRTLSSSIVSLIMSRDNEIVDSTIISTTITVKEFKDLSISLLRKIHTKNSRKPFLSQDVWHHNWTRIRHRQFVNQAASEVFDLQIEEENSDDEGLNNIRRISPSPIYQILQSMPFVVPFEDRVEVFSQLLFLERARCEERAPNLFARGGEIPNTIRRASVFKDGFEMFNQFGKRLKGRISITLVNQLGMPEAGIDGGGVFKEFISLLIEEAFSPKMGLFQCTSDNLLYPDPSSTNRQRSRLRYYEFLGMMVGKAVFEGILINAPFARFFLSSWLSKKSYIDDLPSLDKELYNGLMMLKRYTGNVEKDFSLNFTVEDRDSSGSRTIPLIRNGEKVSVTAMNKIEYIYLVANYRLNKQIQKQTTAFLSGFYTILPKPWFHMFDERELQMIISGEDSPINLEDLKQNVTYSGVYSSDHPLIIQFWKIVEHFDASTLGLLIKFITSCERPPLQGFKALNPQLCIRDSGRSDEWLPTASTCVNLLKLPIYSSPDILKRKLLYAIHSESGFELS